MEYKILKIKKESAVDLVCNEMKELIRSGSWQVDEKIPSENDLAAAFGVNRLTVRLALQKLNTLGVLETRVGEGTFVRPFSFSAHMQEISEFYMTPKLLEDISEYRKVIEVECARLAIQRGSREELAQLREWCVRFEEAFNNYQALDEDADEETVNRLYQVINDADIGFHDTICKMSHNDLFIHAFAIARAPIAQFIKTRGVPRLHQWKGEDNRTSVLTHWGVYQAIKDRDFQRCRSIYYDMIDLRDVTENEIKK